ncbi:MAG: ParA family protein [Oscillochloris sp.]|nr:ParA family protein [Oscillochloris sp.]
MRVITVANEKGGVGKTTTTVSLAAALGQSRRVMVIDLDSQAHATEWFGIPAGRVPAERSSYAVLTGATTLAPTILRTEEPGVVICAAHTYLAKAAQELSAKVDGLFALRDALEALGQSDIGIDDVLIDCPPSKGAVVFNALIAADLVLAPVLAESLSMEGLGELTETVRRVRQRYSPDLPPPRILVNNYEGRSAADRQIHDYLHAQFGPQVLQTEIGRDAPLRECFAARMSILRYRRNARSASQFLTLAAEITEALDAAES